MQCPKCHTENREQRRFCAECGTQLNLTCSSCGFANQPGEKILRRLHFALGNHHLETGRQDEAQKSYRAARNVVDGLKAGLQNSELRSSLQNFSPVKRLNRLIEDKSLGVGYR